MIRRLFIYFNEMFPITAFLGTIFTAVSIQLVYLRLFGIYPQFTLYLILPGLVLASISLLIRVMDEFKDFEDDLKNFPTRPLPSGRVLPKDLKVVGWCCVAFIIIFSLTSWKLAMWSVATLCFTGLMLKWFFIEDKMRKSLPLAFVSHHPIVLFNFTYLILASGNISSLVSFEKWFLVLPLCTIFTNWEIVRKIRAPDQETSYTTYSKIWGPRKSILVALGLQLTFNVTVLMIMHLLKSPMVLSIVYASIQFLLSYPSLRFLFNLKLPSPLKPNAEGQILMVVGFLFIAALI